MGTPNPYFLYPFGTSGDLTTVPNTGASTGTMSYQYAFTPNYEDDLLTNPSALPIPRTQMNQLFFDLTSAVQQIQTQGYPLWVAAGSGGPTGYPIFATVAHNYNSTGINIWQCNSVTAGINSVEPGSDSTWTNISGGSGLIIVVQTFSVSGTYTPSAGMQYCRARIIGGGGSGGGAISSGGTTAGSGGSSGGYVEALLTSTDIGASIAVTIGAGGAGASASSNNGSPSSLGSILIVPGGLGGTANGNNGCVIGAPGVTSGFRGGYIQAVGNPGGGSINIGTILVLSNCISGAGGNSPFGPGGNAVVATAVGNPGLGYGSGGSGGSAIVNNAGGSGKDGFLVIEEFCFT